MCRSQLTCGVMCMGFPVLYTENLIQRQRIRGKYGLHGPTSCSEMGAGCCYPCSIFQSHTFLYLSTHHAARRHQRSGANGSHGPLLSALRAMQRGTAIGSRSQDVAAPQLETRAAVGVPSDPRTAEQRRGSLNESYTSPAKRPEAARPEETTPTAVRQASMSYTATGAHGAVSASSIASSVGETPDQAVTLFGRGRTSSRRATHNIPAPSASSAESRSTPASSSIPPPEVTDSPRVGPPPPYAVGVSLDDAESALADSASFPIPSALPLNNVIRSPPKFEVPPALKPPDSADPEIISAWMQGPKLPHLSQTFQRPADSACYPAHQTSSVAQPSKPAAAGPAESGMSVSDASLFSLALDPAASQASAMPPHQGGAPAHSAGTAASAARATPQPLLAPSELPPLPLPLPTLGSSRDLNAGCATYDTITSSKLSSMIDHAMLGSGSAGRASAAAGSGGGTALSSVDPAGPWDSYRHSTMAPIAEADGEEGPWSNSNLTGSRVAQDLASAASAADGPAASCPRLAPTNSRNSERSLRVNGSAAGGSSESLAKASIRTAQCAPPGASQRGSGGAAVIGMTSGAVCTDGAALTALARMGSDCGSNAITAPGSGRAGGVYTRNPGISTVPPPRRAAAPPAAAALAPGNSTAKPVGVRDSAPRLASAGGDEDDEVDDGMGASADNFSLASVTPPQVLLHGGAQPLQRHGSQSRYGAVPANRPSPAPAPALVASGGCGDDDEVNMASIRPSFIDGPERDHLKGVLRAAGEKADALAAAPASAAPATAQAMSYSGTSASASQKRVVVALPSNAAAFQHRGSSGSRRYGGAQVALPAAAVAGSDAGAAFGAGAAATAPYASYCGDAPSQEDSRGKGGSVDDDASSVIDGPVSSGEEAGSAAVVRPAGAVAGRGSSSVAASSGDPDADGCSRIGDASVSVAVAGPVASRGVCASTLEPAIDPAESAAFVPARHSASGLSNGESNVGYESVADSVCASQHRQKHWVNWMAQSVGMSMAANSVAAAESSRAFPVRTGYGKANGPGGRPPMDPGMSVNQRVPHPVMEESTDGLYKRWGEGSK